MQKIILTILLFFWMLTLSACASQPNHKNTEQSDRTEAPQHEQEASPMKRQLEARLNLEGLQAEIIGWLAILPNKHMQFHPLGVPKQVIFTSKKPLGPALFADKLLLYYSKTPDTFELSGTLKPGEKLLIRGYSHRNSEHIDFPSLISLGPDS